MTDNSNVQTPTQGTVLERTAMLVKLSRHKFNHNAFDKELSAKLMKQCKAEGSNTIRVNKTIIPKEACKPWAQILNEAGKYFYTVTLPWDDKGYRLLPVVKYKEFVSKFRDFQARFAQAVDNFIMNLEKHIQAGKKDLGLAASDDDYVDKQAAREQFILKVEYETVKEGNDFKAKVTEEERQEIAEIVAQQHTEKFAKAQASVFVRIKEVAGALIEKMNEKAPKGKRSPEFRDSIIGNIKNLVDILPSLNVANNPDLDKLKDDIDLHLASIDPEDLRECENLREDTAKRADEIMKQADAFMGKLELKV